MTIVDSTIAQNTAGAGADGPLTGEVAPAVMVATAGSPAV